MKKILFIHHAVGWGGAPINMINLIKRLDNTIYKTEVLLLKDSVVSERLAENNIIYKVAESVFYKRYYNYFTHSEAGHIKWYQIFRFAKLSLLWSLSRSFFAEKELKNHDFDIIHLNSSVLCDWLAPASKFGKTIFHVQEPFRKGKFDFLHHFFKYQMRKYADQIIAISYDNAKRIGLLEKTQIIYNYADIPEKSPILSSYFSKKVLYLGGAASIKGFFTMVEALDFLDEDVKVYFAGSYSASKNNRNMAKRFLKMILRYGKKRNTAVLKMRNHPNAVEIGMTDKVNEYLDEVCCLVSPFSVPHFSRPVIEAHLHKKPAIGADVKGMDEIIFHGQNGLIFPKDNAKALAAAINELASDGKKAKSLGEEGYRRASQKFTPGNIRKFEDIYDKF